MTEENKNPSGKDDLPLATQESAGECVLGIGGIPSSIHSIKVELNKMNAEKITMTLDCCRNVSRDAEAFVVYLKYKINIINYWLLDRDVSEGTSQLLQIQLILPYKISCIWGS